MKMKTALVGSGLFLLEALVAPGCQRPQAPNEASRPIRGLLSGGPADAVAEERRIALAPAGGARAVDTVLTRLQQGVRRQPAKLDGWILLGRAWVRKARETSEPGYYRNAAACAAVALHLEPDNTLALNLRGLVLLNEHQFVEAQQLAEAILKRSDFDPLALGTLSDAQLELGHIDAAEETVQRMLSLKPGLPAYARASYLYFLRGQSGAAKEAIRLAIDASSVARSDPEPRAWALTQAANLFLHEGDYRGADAGYEMALRTLPDYPAALVGRGQVALAEARYRDAAGCFEDAHKQNPLAETARLLGEARTLAGDPKGAAEAFEALLRHGPRTDPRAVALYLASINSDLKRANELISRERRGRNDVHTQDIYAFVLFRSGRLDEARAAIDQVLAIGVKDARMLYHAAEIHAVTGDPSGARALVDDALRRSPHFDVQDERAARALLARLSSTVAVEASLATSR